jgi:two-component system, NarL family, sensor histidine kinase DegS
MLAESGVTLDIKTIGRIRRFDPETETQILRICQEALANSLKHSDATRIDLAFDFSRKRPDVVIKDNGSGFELEKATEENGSHFGLCGMSERVKQLGGRLEIRTGPGIGTEVKVHLN